MGIIVLIISLLVSFGAFTLPGYSAHSTDSAAVTSTSEPDQADVAILRTVGRGILGPDDWQDTPGEQVMRTTLTYRSTRSTSLVYMEYLQFPGLSSTFSMQDYITPDYFDIVLSAFPSWEKVAQCEQRGLFLYEFTAKFDGTDYDIRYWLRKAAPERVLTVSMNFERGTEDIDHYARALFPMLPSCA